MTTAYWAHDRTTHTISISPTVIHGDDEGTFDPDSTEYNTNPWKRQMNASDYSAVTKFSIMGRLEAAVTGNWCLRMTSLKEVSGFENLTLKSNATCASMFSGCTNLVDFDLSEFDTTNCINMGSMFSGCTSLKTLNLIKFNVSAVTSMILFVNNCRNLTTIYVSPEQWGEVTQTVRENNQIFESSPNQLSHLTGHNGTRWSSTNKSGLYARVDTEGAPGYLSLIPGYVWKSQTGAIMRLNTISTRVVRSGISGFAQNCVELSTSSNSNNYGEWVTQQKITRRECSFRIVIKAENHAALEQIRQQFLSAFNCIDGKTGKLHHYTDAGLHRYLNVDDVRVNIRDGLAKGTLAQYQYIDLTFVAADPFFYGDEVTVTSFASAVNNPGDVITPVEITASADTITNTVGTAARSITGTNLTGTVINVTDNSLTAELSGASALNRFSMNSHFWMIHPGDNTIAGASRIVFRPRWSAI